LQRHAGGHSLGEQSERVLFQVKLHFGFLAGDESAGLIVQRGEDYELLISHAGPDAERQMLHIQMQNHAQRGFAGRQFAGIGSHRDRKFL
jgi:hypothetical protein